MTGQNFWLHFTTASVQCLHLSERFFPVSTETKSTFLCLQMGAPHVSAYFHTIPKKDRGSSPDLVHAMTLSCPSVGGLAITS